MVLQLIDGGVTAPLGFQAAGVACGLKKRGGLDLALIKSDLPAECAGAFTQNRVKAAPVLYDQAVVAKGRASAIVVNSGNANACTTDGMEKAAQTAQAVGQRLGLPADEVLVASTGVIGVPLDMGKVLAGVAAATASLSRAGGAQAAQAIMTTDTKPKEVACLLQLPAGAIRLGAMAKGSGMIHPNMATMLAFITTDAAVAVPVLQQLLSAAVAKTFNMISVDGDSSTNDTVLLLANGASGVRVEGDAVAAFASALEEVCRRLAKLIAADGEGATKLVEINVTGAENEEHARQVARCVSRSNLVKTALFGEDANWGRILCAVGYSEVPVDPLRVDISLGELPVAKAGYGLPFDEAAAKAILQQSEVSININLNSGQAAATAWTCDMTYDYIRINASYRT